MNYVAQADAHYAREVGRDNPERAWILSDRDVWYRNPFYTGPAEPHPEDASAEDDYPETVPMEAPAEWAAPVGNETPADFDLWTDDIPF